MKVYYINSENTKIDLLNSPYRIEETDFFSFEWSYNKENRRVKNFYRDVETKKIKIDVNSNNYEEFYTALNNVTDIFNIDISKNVKGRLYFNDYYLECNIFKNDKDLESYVLPYAKVEFSIVADEVQWIKEDEQHFYHTNTSRETDSKKYTYKYPYRYGDPGGQMTVSNEGVVDNNILIRIYGPVTDPAVKIGDNLYQVFTTLEENERLEINTLNRTVKKINVQGEEINCFNDRNKESQIFEKVKPGTATVLWNNTFSFDIVVYNARTEPNWEGLF